MRVRKRLLSILHMDYQDSFSRPDDCLIVLAICRSGDDGSFRGMEAYWSPGHWRDDDEVTRFVEGSWRDGYSSEPLSEQWTVVGWVDLIELAEFLVEVANA